MYVPFENLPANSRIWVYQADRALEKEEQALASNFLTTYCDRWAAHGQPLRASYQITESRFVILAVDESFNGTSGCSVDDSVHAIQHIGSSTGVNFFNRELIAFKQGGEVFVLPFKYLKKAFEDGVWNESTIAFNNLITSKAQLDAGWMVPAARTWLSRYIPSSTVKT